MTQEHDPEGQVQVPASPPAEKQGADPLFLGVDVGSVTTKLVVIDIHGNVISEKYLRNREGPIAALQKGFRMLLQEGLADS